ncbi:MAG TPA: hypothetical protein VKD72_18930, partial [Gemmataceae bacterium]|nr:hypothetical protein [Gemmataceae bacterium]
MLLYVWIRTSAQKYNPGQGRAIADLRVAVRGKFRQPRVPRGAGAPGEVQRGVAGAAQVRGAVVVDVSSPAHVGEARRVLA